MEIGVLGTGSVGQTIAGRLTGLGHNVVMGSRDAANPKAVAWAAEHGGRAGTFADAAAHGTVVFNCTSGVASVAVIEAVGPANLAGTVLVDVANILSREPGNPAAAASESLAEQLQRAAPQARVVKALNTMNCDVMVRPDLLAGEHHTFLVGDDPSAKAVVAGLLGEFGWPAGWIRDLGGLAAARGLELYLPLWLNLAQSLGTSHLNIRVVT
jgi:predicted dinucleotide-binding enzyme